MLMFHQGLLGQNGGGLKGGSLLSSSIGSQSLSLNPANFWTSRKSNFSILLPLSFQLNNTSVSSNWLNSYLFSGKTLDDHSVDNMLGEIPASGLSLNGHGHLMLFGLSYKWLAMYIGGSADAYGTIPKSIFNTVFQGIEFDRTIDLSDTRFGMQAVLPVSFVLSGKIGNSLYMGLGVKGLLGLAYLSINSSGGIISHEDKLSGNGSVDIQYNMGDLYIERDSLLAYSAVGKFSPSINGKGYAIDLGVTKLIGNKWTLGFSIQNIMGTINWDQNTSHSQVIQFDMDLNSGEFEEISDYTESQQDSLMESIITKEVTTTIDNLTSTFPLRIEVASDYVFGTQFLMFNSISYEDESTIIPESQLEFSGGFRWLIHRRIPVTFGITYNSLWGIKWGGGLGAHFNNYHLDILFSQNGGFINEAKGFSLNLINYFYF
jgi:hypothetical protein